jgi:hypothetical protein
VTVLARAVDRSNAARSADITLVEHVKLGGRTLTTVRIDGLQEPRARSGSFHYAVSPAQPGLGEATMIVRGANVYVHYPILDTLQARTPGLKHWLLVNTHSSLGVDPGGLISLGAKEVHQITDLAVVGGGSEDGMPVTRYRGTLALAKIAGSSQIQSLLASLPSVAATILKGHEQVRISVGNDGFIHHVSSVITAPRARGTRLTITIDAALANFDRETGTISGPPASQVMTMSQFQALTGSAPTAAANALLAKTVLGAAQVGSGYRAAVIPGGKLVAGETTLDFCDQTYSSEKLRTARLQVAYTAKHTNIELSNEVVSYQAGGAQQALAEMRQAARSCANGPVPHPPAGVRNAVRHTQLLTDPHLLPGAVAILETDSAIVKGKQRTEQTIAVFQVRGNVLSGVYGYGSSLAAVKRLTLAAAEASAVNLRKHVATTPSA